MAHSVVLYNNAVRDLIAAQKEAIRLTASQIRTELIESQVLPFDEGTLQNVATNIDDAMLSQGTIKITHDTPYAARLYYHPEFNFQRTFNVNAKGLWWEDWIVGSKANRPVVLYEYFYRRAARRYVV